MVKTAAVVAATGIEALKRCLEVKAEGGRVVYSLGWCHDYWAELPSCAKKKRCRCEYPRVQVTIDTNTRFRY